MTPGQTPSGIAGAFGVDLAEFLQLNNIRDPRTGLKAWEVVRITWGPDLVGGVRIEDVGNVHYQAGPTELDYRPAHLAEVEDLKGRSNMAIQFKDPTGKVLPAGSRNVTNYGSDSSRPVIDKGDGSFLTPGNPKDAQWTADRIKEGKGLGLNTAGWWEASPTSIQGAINAARRKAAAATAQKAPVGAASPASAADDWRKQVELDKLELSRQRVQNERARLEMQQKQAEDDAKLAWFKAVNDIQGPADWVSYWNQARGAEGTGSGLPAWFTSLVDGALPEFADVTGGTKHPLETRHLPAWVLDLGARVFPDFPKPPLAGVPGVSGRSLAFEQAIQPPSPLKVGPQAWRSLLPSEQEGLQGLVDQSGGYSPDWLASMRRSWPQWSRAPRTKFV